MASCGEPDFGHTRAQGGPTDHIKRLDMFSNNLPRPLSLPSSRLPWVLSRRFALPVSALGLFFTGAPARASPPARAGAAPRPAPGENAPRAVPMPPAMAARGPLPTVVFAFRSCGRGPRTQSIAFKLLSRVRTVPAPQARAPALPAGAPAPAAARSAQAIQSFPSPPMMAARGPPTPQLYVHFVCAGGAPGLRASLF